MKTTFLLIALLIYLPTRRRKQGYGCHDRHAPGAVDRAKHGYLDPEHSRSSFLREN